MEMNISARDSTFLIALAFFLIFLVGIPLYYYVRVGRGRKRDYGSWDSLVQRLMVVDHKSVELIARDWIDGRENLKSDFEPAELDPEEIWPMIGGMEGMEIVLNNCKVLVEMVFYLQQWYPEALAVTEQLRLNAREIEWHVDRLKSAARTGRLKSYFPDYAQKAIATYYLMTRRVLEIYEQGHFPGLPDLQKAL
jgi:hypothetical protein